MSATQRPAGGRTPHILVLPYVHCCHVDGVKKYGLVACACGQLVVGPREMAPQKGRLALCPALSLLNRYRWLGVGMDGGGTVEFYTHVSDCCQGGQDGAVAYTHGCGGAALTAPHQSGRVQLQALGACPHVV